MTSVVLAQTRGSVVIVDAMSETTVRLMIRGRPGQPTTVVERVNAVVRVLDEERPQAVYRWGTGRFLTRRRRTCTHHGET